MPNSPTLKQKWFSVSDVTSVTRLEERHRSKSQLKSVQQMDLQYFTRMRTDWRGLNHQT